ncbi:MAG: hypothetical protein ABMB14_06285, partial [Myxococcota bacterium]
MAVVAGADGGPGGQAAERDGRDDGARGVPDRHGPVDRQQERLLVDPRSRGRRRQGQDLPDHRLGAGREAVPRPDLVRQRAVTERRSDRLDRVASPDRPEIRAERSERRQQERRGSERETSDHGAPTGVISAIRRST